MNKISFILPAFLFLFLSSCKEVSSPSIPSNNDHNQVADNPKLNLLGTNGIQRHYIYTVSDMNLKTNKPVILPPDSLFGKVQFPESLYTIGIFTYGQSVELNTILGDTLWVYDNVTAYNLFTITDTMSNGEFGMSETIDYYADSNNIYRNDSFEKLDAYKYVVYKLPFVQNDRYVSNGDTITVIGEVDINIKAGTFHAFEITKHKRINPQTDLLRYIYIVPDIGICIDDEFDTTHEIDEATGEETVIQQRMRRELESYN
jgi:hypothetical protein